MPVSVNKNNIIVTMNNKDDISSVLNEFLQYGKIIDFCTEDTPLEDIIYDIYTNGE